MVGIPSGRWPTPPTSGSSPVSQAAGCSAPFEPPPSVRPASGPRRTPRSGRRSPVHARRPTVLSAERECVREDVFTPHLVVQDMEPPSWIPLGRHVQRPLEPPGFRGGARLTPIPLPLARPSAPRTRAPSLHRRYPASSVLWAPPTPASPVPRRDRYQVAPATRQASRVASQVAVDELRAIITVEPDEGHRNRCQMW